MKKWLALLLTLLLLGGTAQAGGKTDEALLPQAGAYDPEYSVTATHAVLPGQHFTLVIYRDGGTLPLRVTRNSGSLPAGAELASNTQDGRRQACIQGLVYAEGAYTFSVLIEEKDGDGARALAILYVTLRVTSQVETVEPYLGDGRGMLRVDIDGVNFRRTPGGTRLGQYDEGDRLVWCATEKKGGYTWYRVWSAEYGYGYLRGDMVKEDSPMRLVYTPGKETAFPLFITAGVTEPLTPSLIMTQAPEIIGFDADPLVTVVRGTDTWTLLCFCIEGEERFWIKADLRDASGAPLECQLIYLTPEWEETPAYVEQ